MAGFTLVICDNSLKLAIPGNLFSQCKFVSYPAAMPVSFAGYRMMQEYILTQHPLPSTVLDFWHMVWHYRVTTVACLSPEVGTDGLTCT